eukprot:8101950-Karenia_brevis.AAC.1
MARYLLTRDRVVWHFKWQEDSTYCKVEAASDWGAHVTDRKSTSGGLWMVGDHCIKTWPATQGAYAL